MADGADERDGPAGAPGGGWVPVPDPTKLTTEAVERATSSYRRETQALRETLETRMAGADEDRSRIWERLRDLPLLYEQFTVHLRDEMFRQDRHDREVLTQRLDDLDRSRVRDSEERAAELEHRRREFLNVVQSAQGLLEQRMAGMDRALKLMAEETARALSTADAGDERTRTETNERVTALRELIEQRLGAMDIATRVLASSVEKFPTDLDRSATSTREVLLGEIRRVLNVTEEKFSAVDALFASNALALAAALAAQEKAVAAQNDSNTLAISKSESSTKETIAANAAQAQTANASLAAQVTDIKERVVRIESSGAGVTSVTGSPFDAGVARKAEQDAESARQRAIVAIAISGILLLVSLASVLFAVLKK
jgi:hypothetical protein